ncbi:MAG: hypothetical protein KDN20_00960 [Verrucomicrobiae bacterium]|nr:hypothetical protein [Verrucomicrobiae bacterium]
MIRESLRSRSRHLDAIRYDIADVGGAHLGVANGFTITIDDDAGGVGADRWFIDPTPRADEEFGETSNGSASGRYDLLSTLMHEQGHVLGLGDVFGDQADVMDGFLGVGTRRLPMAGQAEGAVPGALTGAFFLTADLSRAFHTSNGEQPTGGRIVSAVHRTIRQCPRVRERLVQSGSRSAGRRYQWPARRFHQLPAGRLCRTGQYRRGRERKQRRRGAAVRVVHEPLRGL